MQKWSKLFAMLLIVFIFVGASISVTADFGDFSGDSDYGGSDYDYDYDDYNDYGSSSSYGGSRYNSSGTSDSGATVFACITIGVIYFLVLKKLRTNEKTKGNKPAGARPTTGLSPIDKIYSWDKDFSADEIKQRLSNLYVQMQNCWTEKDLTQLRGDFTDELFAQYDRQLKRYRDEKQTNIIERIAVLDVKLAGVKQDANHDILIVNMSTRITDYTIDDNTGKVIRGDKKAEKFMNYEWTLIRPKGSQTLAQNNTAFNCPNCGAAMDVNKSAQCPFCKSIVSKAEYEWVIAGIKGLSQRTS